MKREVGSLARSIASSYIPESKLTSEERVTAQHRENEGAGTYLSWC